MKNNRWEPKNLSSSFPFTSSFSFHLSTSMHNTCPSVVFGDVDRTKKDKIKKNRTNDQTIPLIRMTCVRCKPHMNFSSDTFPKRQFQWKKLTYFGCHKKLMLKKSDFQFGYLSSLCMCTDAQFFFGKATNVAQFIRLIIIIVVVNVLVGRLYCKLREKESHLQ